MKTAIVTGASSGIGLQCAKMLSQNGYEVFGIGRCFQEKVCFNIIEEDITNTSKILSVINEIKRKNGVDLLMNCAGVAYYGTHEQLTAQQIKAMLRTNAEAPMIITNALINELSKNRGIIINISSVTAKERNPHGCVYGATKAALTSFSESLFEEVRKRGIKVITIHPDMTDTALYRNADFTPKEDEKYCLSAESISQALKFALSTNENTVVTDITLKPQLKGIKKR